MGTVHIRHANTPLALGLALRLLADGGTGVAPDSARTAPCVLPPPAVRAWQIGALAPDRLQHASLAFSLGLALGIMSGEPAAAGGAAALALAKEAADGRRGRFDRGDLLAGLAGAACAALAIAAVER